MELNNKEKQLALSLVNCETEDEVVEVLQEHNYWDADQSYWLPYGGIDNNMGQINSQASNSTGALVEKITNSGDALLVLESWKRNIDPEGPNVPKTMKEALELFFGYPNGDVTSTDRDILKDVSQKIGLITSGRKSKPCYSIYDLGCGQSPISLPNTILSLGLNNKDKIPFTQGIFNQGGSAALIFCSLKHRLQLVISKQHRSVKFQGSDSSDYYGVTVVRREKAPTPYSNPHYTYLAPGGLILKFKTDSLNILPAMPEKNGKHFPHGTFIKMYEYQNSSKSLNSWSHLRLGADIGVFMPGLPFPISSYDCRKIGKESRPRMIKGLEMRINDAKNKVIEEDFPISTSIDLKGQKVRTKIYVFKSDAGEIDQRELRNWKKNVSIVFTSNGQTQVKYDQNIFNRKMFRKIRYISRYIFVNVDCSNLSNETRVDLFSSDREKVNETELFLDLQEQVLKLIIENDAIKKLALERLEKDQADQMTDSSDIKTIFEDLVRQDQDLTELFKNGLDGFLNPFSLGSGKTSTTYKGMPFPTQFKLTKEFPVGKPKQCHIEDNRYKVHFKTDANNDYFDRSDMPGRFELLINGDVAENYTLSLSNGKATLSFTLPSSIKEGQTAYCDFIVTDDTRTEPFKDNNFNLMVINGRSVPGNGISTPISPTIPGEGDQKDKNRLELPFHIQPLNHKDWNYDNGLNEKKSIYINISPEDEKHIFYINMENDFLLNSIKEKPNEMELLQKIFQIGTVLTAWRYIEALKNESDYADYLDEATKRVNDLGPIIIPLMRQHSKIKVISEQVLLAA